MRFFFYSWLARITHVTNPGRTKTRHQPGKETQRVTLFKWIFVHQLFSETKNLFSVWNQRLWRWAHARIHWFRLCPQGPGNVKPAPFKKSSGCVWIFPQPWADWLGSLANFQPDLLAGAAVRMKVADRGTELEQLLDNYGIFFFCISESDFLSVCYHTIWKWLDGFTPKLESMLRMT